MEDAYVLKLSDRKFSDLYLCFCGYAKCESLHSFGPAVRPNYIIHYILEGRGNYMVKEETYSLSAGEGFLIEPNVQTFYQADKDEPWSYVWVGFSGSRAEEYVRDLGLSSGHPVFHSGHAAELKLTVVNMLKNNTCTTKDQFLLESLLYSFFAILSRDIRIPSGSRKDLDNLYVRKAVEYIQNNYPYHIRVTDIADYVCIDRSYLYTVFRKYLNVSPHEYLTNHQLTCAVELLTMTELSIDSVAQSCGFTDARSFARIFKAKRGMTPSQYRRQSLKADKEHLLENMSALESL